MQNQTQFTQVCYVLFTNMLSFRYIYQDTGLVGGKRLAEILLLHSIKSVVSSFDKAQFLDIKWISLTPTGLDIKQNQMSWPKCPGKTHVVVIFFFGSSFNIPRSLFEGWCMSPNLLEWKDMYIHRKIFGPKIALKNDGGHYSWALHWLDST